MKKKLLIALMMSAAYFTSYAQSSEEQVYEPETGASCQFALRTNLLYYTILIPNVGLEWRVNPAISMKVDGGWTHWGTEHGNVQKLWYINPEVRRYMGAAKRFYLGVGATAGAYNIYKGMLGNLISRDTGYQGTVYSGGLTLGYQAPLGKSLSLDFNLGLGYARFEYDTFTLIDDTRVYRAKDQARDWYGPIQAGISLVWLISGN